MNTRASSEPSDERPRRRSQGLIGATLSVFVGNAVESVAVLVTGMVLVRHLVDRADFATFSQTMVLVETLVAFVPLGLHRAIVFFFPRTANRRGYVLRTIVMTSVLVAGASVALYALRDPLSGWLNNARLAAVVPLIGGLMWTTNAKSVAGQILVAEQRFRTLGLVTGALGVAQCAAVAVATQVGLGVHGIVWSVLAVQLLWMPVTAWLVFQLPGRRGERSGLVAQLRYSLPLAFASLSSMIGRTIDRFLVMSLYPAEVYAGYDRGAVTVPFLSQIPYAFSHSLQPRLTTLFKDGQTAAFIDLWRRSLVASAAVMLPVMAYCLALAPTLMVFVNTESYLESTTYFRIYLWLIPLQMTVYPMVLMATGRTSNVLLVTLAGTGLKIALSLALSRVERLGVAGPAVATVVVEAASAAAYLFVIARQVGVSMGSVVPWSRLFRLAVASAISGAVVWPFVRLEIPAFWVLLVASVAWLPAYVVAVRLVRVFDVEEWRALLEPLPTFVHRLVLVERWLGPARRVEQGIRR